jgi:hypothetical protein
MAAITVALYPFSLPIHARIERLPRAKNPQFVKVLTIVFTASEDAAIKLTPGR